MKNIVLKLNNNSDGITQVSSRKEIRSIWDAEKEEYLISFQIIKICILYTIGGWLNGKNFSI